MATKSQDIKYDIFNGKPIHPKVSKRLNEMNVNVIKMFKQFVTQGKGEAKASNGTHSEGYAIDIVTRSLTDEQIRIILNELNTNGFAAVLRLKGDKLSSTIVNKTEHIHAALIPYSNSKSVLKLIQPGERNHVDKKLQKRVELRAKGKL